MQGTNRDLKQIKRYMTRRLANNVREGSQSRLNRFDYVDTTQEFFMKRWESEDEWVERPPLPTAMFKRRRRRSFFEERHDFYTV